MLTAVRTVLPHRLADAWPAGSRTPWPAVETRPCVEPNITELGPASIRIVAQCARHNMPEPSASTKRNLLTAAKGGGMILGGKLFNHGGRLLTAIVVARFLAADQYGEYNLGLTTAEVLAGFASLGLHKALVRYIPISVREGDRAGLWGTLQFCVGLNGVISLLFGIGLFALAGPVANGIFHDPQVPEIMR